MPGGGPATWDRRSQLSKHAGPYRQGNVRPLIAAGGQGASDCPVCAAISLEWVGLVARVPPGDNLAPQPGQPRTARVEPAAFLPSWHKKLGRDQPLKITRRGLLGWS